MTKPTRAAPPRSVPKTPTTQEAVRRMQRSTAPTNGGQQAPWVGRLQSTAARQAARAISPTTPSGSKGLAPAAGQRGGKAPRASKTH